MLGFLAHLTDPGGHPAAAETQFLGRRSLGEDCRIGTPKGEVAIPSPLKSHSALPFLERALTPEVLPNKHWPKCSNSQPHHCLWWPRFTSYGYSEVDPAQQTSSPSQGNLSQKGTISVPYGENRTTLCSLQSRTRFIWKVFFLR